MSICKIQQLHIIVVSPCCSVAKQTEEETYSEVLPTLGNYLFVHLSVRETARGIVNRLKSSSYNNVECHV